MVYRRFLSVVACASLALAITSPAAAAPAQDATSSVLAERAELDKALAADSESRTQLLEKFLADHPESVLGEQAREALVRSHATVGEVALKNRDPKAATDAFNRAVDAAGDKITDRLFRNVIWPMPVVMASAGYRFEAIQLMKSFEKRFESSPERLVQIGYFYVTIESANDAVRALEQAVALAPDDHGAYNSLGTAYIISLRLDDAAAAYARAIELEPKEEFAYAGLANLKRAFGNSAEAIELYKKQLEIKPDDPETYAGLAVAHMLEDDDASAAAAFGRALALAPNNFRLYTQIAYLYASRGRFDKAREMTDLSMRYEPRFTWTHIALGNLLLGQKKYDEAIKALLDAQQYGDFPTLHFELAKAYMVDDRFSEAIGELSASFDITDDGQFETRLGDVLDLKSSKLDLLLERERQAVLFLPVQPTTPTQYRLAESLARIAHFLAMIPDAAMPVSAPEPEPERDDVADIADAGLTAAPLEGPPPASDDPDGSESRPRRQSDAEQGAAPVEAAPPPEQIIYSEPPGAPAGSPLVFRPRRVAARVAPAPAPEEAGEPAVALSSEEAGEEAPSAGPAPGEEAAADPSGSESASAPPERPSANGREVDPTIREQLVAAIDAFVGVDDGREAFRKLWVARQLAEKGVLLDRAQDLAQQALDAVETATALEGSVRDMPDADAAARRAALTARSQDALGWVLLKRGEREEGLELLRRSSESAAGDPEQYARLWRLGVAEQENGNERAALDLYLQSYDPASPAAPVRKQIIQALYVKVHGSADGLDQKLTRQ